jgi:NADH:ubiquinone oxidoreductase subunit 3 (subunit A)
MNNLLMLFIFVPILALVFLFLNFLFAVHRPDESKISAYECGYSAIRKQNRTDFQIQFYVVAMLFLIFDLEILLLFPIAVTLYKVSTFGFSIALIFFVVLTIGFILEIGSGAISIAKTTHTKFNK